MLDKNGFNAWARTYDTHLREQSQLKTYPFAGYFDVLYTIYDAVKSKQAKSVLDIGVGTGTLIKRFYDENLAVYGMDFSDTMINACKRKIFKASLFVYDMNDGLHPSLKANTYDAIISSYALHHISIPKQIDLINQALTLTKKDGIVVIGDIMFETQKDLEEAKKAAKDKWEEEYYLVYAQIKDQLPAHTYHPISFCAGVLIFTP